MENETEGSMSKNKKSVSVVVDRETRQKIAKAHGAASEVAGAYILASAFISVTDDRARAKRR
jgi:hypothetical protein